MGLSSNRLTVPETVPELTADLIAELTDVSRFFRFSISPIRCR
jgi:hypothetical protein